MFIIFNFTNCCKHHSKTFLTINGMIRFVYMSRNYISVKDIIKMRPKKSIMDQKNTSAHSIKSSIFIIFEVSMSSRIGSAWDPAVRLTPCETWTSLSAILYRNGKKERITYICIIT
jgi:hypothetical protein